MNKQAMRDILVFWLGLIGCILVIGYCMVVKVAADIHNVKTDMNVIQDLQRQVEELQQEIKSVGIVEQFETEVNFEKIETDDMDISRGYEKVESLKMKVTAYDLSYASCRKYPGHPEYGITASGNRVQEWHTIAAGAELPFGTKVFIPYFHDKPNGGIFIVQDRGSAIKTNCLDIYMPNNSDCMGFGVKELDVYVLD